MSFYSTTGTTATTAAETAQTKAEAAKTAAEAAQAAVELLHDDFDDRYLGSKASSPTVDNDGNALAAGTMYFDTSTSRMRVYSGSAWADITAVQGALITGNNLSDLTDDGAARTNLGLGTAATQNSSAFATAAQADQTVALTAGTGITTSGTYPNFTITNSSPDQTVGLTGAGATSISGTYPNFTITSTDTTYNVGDNGLTQVNFTSALNTKLAGIEASADVTDTTNVVAALTAGSNITIAADGTIAAPVAGITYSNSWVDSGSNALLRLTPSSGSAQDLTLAAGSNVSLSPSGSTLTISSTDTTYSVTDGQLSQNNFTNTLKSKLDGIEVQADVTDATNVSSAGAVMKTLYSAGSFLYATSSNNPESKNASQVRTILNVADGANNYVHPSHDGDDIDLDTGGLSGSVVISDLDFNITTDSLGHVTDANASFATRNLTLANLGYTGTTDATTNDTDANLKARANHTGTQAQSTIVDLVSDLAGKQEILTFGIGDSNTVQINSSTVADNDFAKFTPTGLEGRDASEVRSDINVADGATANDTDANLKARANHTGTQAISTVSGLQTALDAKVDTVSGKGLSANDFTDADHSKLDGIAASATANDTDANLKARANHTGTQAISTILGLQAALDAKQGTVTFGIGNTNALKIDDANAADNEYLKLTANGAEGRNTAEMLADLGVEAGADVTDSLNVAAAGALMDSEVDSLMGIKTLDVPTSTTISTFAKTFLDDPDAATVRGTLDLSNYNIQTYYEANSDRNAFTDALLTKLNSVESNATADQTASEIKTAYESNSDTNAFTDADHSKLDGIEANATADQSAAEIEAGYNSQVSKISTGEANDGTQTTVRRMAPADIKSMIDTHGGSYTHPNHSGDVTSSGDGATTITNGAVTLAKMANISENTFLGRGYVGSGPPTVLTPASARSILSHTNDKSTCVYAKYFSNATVKIYDDNDLEIWWDSTQKQIKYKPTSSNWSYIDGSHLHVTGTSGSTNTATVTAWANDISSNYNVFQYLSNDNNASTATALAAFNLDDQYGSSDRFTLIKETHSSGFVAFHGIVFIGGTGSVAIQLWEIAQ